MKISLCANANRYVLAVCAVIGMHASVALSKANDLASFRKQPQTSFADFVKNNLDTSVIPSADKKDVAIELPMVAVNSGDLTQLRATQKLTFASFIRAEKIRAPEPQQSKQPVAVATISAPAKAEPVVVEKPLIVAKEPVVVKTAEPTPVVQKEAIKIVVEDRKGKSKETEKIITTVTQPTVVSSDKKDTQQQKQLTVLVKKATVSFSETSVQLASLKDSVAIKLIDAETGKAITSSAKASMFVRNDKVAQIVNHSLKALSEGQTELYVIAHGKAHFLPITVESELSAPKLELANEFFKLDLGVEGKTAQARISHSSVADQSKGDDVLATESEVVNTTNTQSDYRIGKRALSYRNVKIQLVDDRSDKVARRVFPVSNLRVQIVGTKFVGYTDGLGTIELNDLPAYSRLLLRVDDPSGKQVRSAILQLDTEKPAQIFTMIRHQSLTTYESALNAPPTSSTGTLCGVVKDDRDNQQRKANVAVTIDASAIGPYYFNQYGFLDLAQRVTGLDGRFCFFNVAPGPATLHFFANSRYIATNLTAAFAGSHNYEEFYVYDPMPVSAKLAMFGNAHEQFDADTNVADSLKSVDMVDLIPLGRGEPMTYTDVGVVDVVDGADIHAGKTFVVSQSSDFETAFYGLKPNTSQRDNVVSLFPRGFIDVMASEYAHVAYDPALGTVIVEHNVLEGQVDGAEVRLIDKDGVAVGDGYYYSDFPRTKAIFFNVQPGEYSVIIETKDGYWLAADTVYVFSETLSFIRTGSPVVQK